MVANEPRSFGNQREGFPISNSSVTISTRRSVRVPHSIQCRAARCKKSIGAHRCFSPPVMSYRGAIRYISRTDHICTLACCFALLWFFCLIWFLYKASWSSNSLIWDHTLHFDLLNTKFASFMNSNAPIVLIHTSIPRYVCIADIL